MARLVYTAITSLDGYVVDAQGSFEWAAPDEDVHAVVNERERQVGTYVYGRRMYEVMRYWGGADEAADQSEVVADYRSIWQRADKVVVSRTLTDADLGTERTTLRPDLDPVWLRSLKQSSPTDLSVGGPTLAAEALRHGLVDEVTLFVNPTSVGGGTPALPRDQRLELALVGHRSFADGTVMLSYGVRGTL